MFLPTRGSDCKGPFVYTQRLRAESSSRTRWLSRLLTSTSRNQSQRTICARPNASLGSVLFSCIINAAFACRAWMHTTGSPASRRACQCHTHKGPVSSAIRITPGARFKISSAMLVGVRTASTLPYAVNFFIHHTDCSLLQENVESHMCLHHFTSSWMVIGLRLPEILDAIRPCGSRSLLPDAAERQDADIHTAVFIGQLRQSLA
jgi:hypothetical protein